MNYSTKHKKAFITAGVISVALLCILIATQIVFTVSAVPVKVNCIKWDNTYEEVVYLAEKYNKNSLDSSEHSFSFDGTLPSDNPDDYMMISAFIDIRNKSYIDNYSVKAVISSADKFEENILFTFDADSVMSIRLHRHEEQSATVMAYAYVGNLSDDEIKELAKSLNASLDAEGTLFGRRKRNVSFKSCQDITVKDNRESSL